ncbi:MAG: putative ABC transporter permease [Oscillospiraceae bacterium]|nr:putative ABC transporter permease [Oscillospiraceae bacterium]
MQHVYIGFLDHTLFQVFFFFSFWSVFGWFMEVIDRTLETGGFENRGFLNGPFCPIYGFGVLLLEFLLRPLQNNLVLLYILSVIICSTVELSVGLLLERLFHAKWWDYSDKKFNYKGFICLKISLLWGVGSVMVIRVVQPLIEKLVNYLPYTFGNILAILTLATITTDLFATLGDIRNFNMRLKQVDYIATLLHDKSIALGENISDEVLTLNTKYEKLSEQIKSSRLVRAFPTMRPNMYANTFKAIKNRINKNNDTPDFSEYNNTNKLLITKETSDNENKKI